MPRKIKKIKKKLNFDFSARARDQRIDLYHPKRKTMKRKWETENKKGSLINRYGRFLPMLFMLTFGFFLAALVFYFLFSGRQNISSENIEIEIRGPVFVTSGGETPINISITNDNSIPIEFADLVINYPSGTKSSKDNTTLLTRERKGLGSIEPEETKTAVINPIIYGSAGSSQEIVIGLDYRLSGSNAQFAIEKPYNVSIQSSPIALIVRGTKRVISDENFPLEVEIKSNSQNTIDDLVLVLEYPFGYKFLRSNRSSRFQNTLWEIGRLNEGQNRVINISGALTGNNNEERTFRFRLGVADPVDKKRIGSLIAEETHSIVIDRPFIELQLTLNQNADDTHIIDEGTEVKGVLWWVNNTQNTIRDVEIILSLAGNGLNKTSVRVPDGFYDEKEDTILWSRDTHPELRTIASNGRGNVEFSFSVVEDDPIRKLTNRSVDLSIDVSGIRDDGTNQAKKIEGSIKRNLKLTSEVSLFSRSVYSDGPFQNEGPIPPKVGEKTTYTISLIARNSSNTMRNTVLTSTLPFYVNFEKGILPENEDATYDEDTRTIRWNIQELGANTFDNSREISFQVSITPTISQLGEPPVLLNNQRFDSFDIFTGKPIRLDFPPITTEIRGDLIYRRGIGNVTSDGDL
ncbi:MAG: hypothetical protein OXU73_02790 [Candidatus Campbellbacteria bacterium]|nr:hypothetical protein [Candidatus Campbellbacteria bacterium]